MLLAAISARLLAGDEPVVEAAPVIRGSLGRIDADRFDGVDRLQHMASRVVRILAASDAGAGGAAFGVARTRSEGAVALRLGAGLSTSVASPAISRAAGRRVAVGRSSSNST
jgi:hypothetical protein